MKRLSAWVVRNVRVVFAAAVVLFVGAGVFDVTSPVTAALCAFGVVVLLIAGLMVAGLVTERLMAEDEDERPAGWPAARFAASADLREPVKIRDVVRSMERYIRRHAHRGGA